MITICLQGSIKKRHPSGRKRTRDLPDYARVVYREGMPSQQAISSAAAFKLGHGHPGLTHIAERREHNICPEWFLCRRGKAAPASSSIVNDACLQKVSMHTCMHALQARCSVMFPCCAHRADTYWGPSKGPSINDVQKSIRTLNSPLSAFIQHLSTACQFFMHPTPPHQLGRGRHLWMVS